MSTYVLEDENLNAILKGCQFYFKDVNLVKGGLNSFKDFDSKNSFSNIGQILKEENFRSVNNRYNEEVVVEPFKYNASAPLYDVVQLLKLCDCYEYQSCENKDYSETLACKIINRIRKNLIAVLPGYNDAKWGL